MPHHDEDPDVPEWLLDLAGLVGMSRVQARFKVARALRHVLRVRRELSPPSSRVRSQRCEACGAWCDVRVRECPSCGARMGAAWAHTLRRLGLSLPRGASVSSLVAALLLLIYLRLMLANPGQGYFTWDPAVLVGAGAHVPILVQSGQPWRLATGVVLHIGLWHILMNLLALSQVGPSIEDVFGRGPMLLSFMVLGVLANVVSEAVGLPPFATQAGASGALMGLIGMAAGWGHRVGTPQGRDVRDQMLKWGAYTMVFGLAVNADNGAHGGGFVLGAALGFALARVTLPAWAKLASGVVGGVLLLVTVSLTLRPPQVQLDAARAWERDEAPQDPGAWDDGELGAP